MQLVEALVRERPQEAWGVVLAMIEAAPNDLVLANVAAGPVEDLLARHGELVIEQIEQAALRNPKLRSCLEMVWGENRIDERIRLRAMAAARDS